jgi:hypothetical protein
VAQRKTVRKTNSRRRTSSPSPKKATASRKTKSGATKATDGAPAKSVGDQEVTIDRRRAHLRKGETGAEAGKPGVAPQMLERRKKVNRRRQIDPTTCERDYTGDEIEFMNALDDYKRKSGRMFPTCSEVLEVVRALGYVKDSAANLAAWQLGSTSAVAEFASTNWFAGGGGSGVTDDDEAMLESALAD